LPSVYLLHLPRPWLMALLPSPLCFFAFGPTRGCLLPSVYLPCLPRPRVMAILLLLSSFLHSNQLKGIHHPPFTFRARPQTMGDASLAVTGIFSCSGTHARLMKLFVSLCLPYSDHRRWLFCCCCHLFLLSDPYNSSCCFCLLYCCLLSMRAPMYLLLWNT
jgi:hypothetical protein